MNYHWPGNVRELENIIERAMIISNNNVLQLGDWFAKDIAPDLNNRPMKLNELEREHILVVLGLTKWRIRGDGGAAEILGLKPTTLEAKMKKLDISRN